MSERLQTIIVMGLIMTDEIIDTGSFNRLHSD